MTFESMVQFDPRLWPIAIMAFLRIVTILSFMPILGDRTIPPNVRILLSLVFTWCWWPYIESFTKVAHNVLQWSPITLALATLREVFFALSLAFSMRFLFWASTMAGHLVGINMGFQTATLFSHTSEEQESPFSLLYYWIVVMIIFSFNIHHIFIKEILFSFKTVPIGAIAPSEGLLALSLKIITSAFILMIKIGAPLLAVQFLLQMALGVLSRSVPQFNVFLFNFPLSYLISMGIFFLGAGVLVRYLGQQGSLQMLTWIESIRKIFSMVSN